MLLANARWSPPRPYNDSLLSHFDEKYINSSLSSRQRFFWLNRKKPNDEVLNEDEFINVFGRLYSDNNNNLDVTYTLRLEQTSAINNAGITVGELAFLVSRKFNIKKYFNSKMADQCCVLREHVPPYEALGWAALFSQSALDETVSDYLKLAHHALSFDDIVRFTEAGIYDVDAIIKFTQHDVDGNLLDWLVG